MKTNKAAFAAIAVLGLAGGSRAAHADTDINGEVGLPLNPTAQIPLPGGVRVQGDYFDQKDGVKIYGIHAAGRVGDQIEINGGIARLNGVGVLNKTGIDIGAKYLFTRETDPVGVRIAAGVGYSQALLKNTHVYVVGTKSLGAVSGDRLPVTGHLGLRYDRFSPGNGFGKSSKASVYAGAEVPLSRRGNFFLVGEVGSKNIEGGSTPFSISARFRPAGQGFSVNVGAARQGFNRTGLFAQIGYSFDTSQLGG